MSFLVISSSTCSEYHYSFQMRSYMDESDSEEEMIKVRSLPKPPTLFPQAPESIDFKLKIKPVGKKSLRLQYTLKEGQDLPYKAALDFQDYKIIFGRDLKPSMGEAWHVDKDGEFWVFKGTA
jgi:hypothetical protein